MATSTTQPAIIQMADNTGLKAGFVSRAIALMVDVFIILVVAGVSYLFITGTLTLMRVDINGCTEFVPLGGLRSFYQNICHVSRFLITAFIISIAPLYFLLFWLFAGRTIGMGITGLRVVRTNGKRLRLPTAIMRLIGFVLCILTLGVGFLWAIIDDDRQGLHDKIARTYVVYWGGRFLYSHPPLPGSFGGVPEPKSATGGIAIRPAANATAPTQTHAEEKS